MAHHPSDSPEIQAKLFAAELAKDLPSIDFHGFRTDGIESRLEAFLYDHYKKGTDAVEIVYGIGEDRLRPVVLAYLHDHPLVADFKERVGNCIVVIGR